MFYNSFILITLLFLSACSSLPSHTVNHPHTEKVSTTQKTAMIDISLYRKGLTELNQEHYAVAMKIFYTIIGEHPDLAGPWANLALINIKNHNLDKAQKNLKHALALDSSMPQIYNMLGFIEKQKGNINKAVDYYELAIAKKPDYALAHYNLALLYDVYLQDIPDAITHYKRYLALGNTQDKKTADWVNELESTLKRGSL